MHNFESGEQINLQLQLKGLYPSGRINSEYRQNVFGFCVRINRIVQLKFIWKFNHNTAPFY